MDFHDFPSVLGKSGVDLFHPSSYVRAYRRLLPRSYAHRADRLRMELLLLNGGIYVDMDSLVLRDLTPLREQVWPQAHGGFLFLFRFLWGSSGSSVFIGFLISLWVRFVI